MREPRMRGIAQVFQIELPVAIVSMFEHAAGNLDCCIGRAIDHVVERGRHESQEILKARTLGRLAGEDKATIAFHARDPDHRGLGIVRIEVARIAVLQRH